MGNHNLESPGGFTARKAIYGQLSAKRIGQCWVFVFGLNTRLGRLHYFLATIAVAVAMTAIVFAIGLSAYHTTPRGMPLSLDTIKWPVIVIGIIFMLITLTLQSMRIRDIGWDPVCVIPGWIAVLIIDMVVANKFPTLSLGHEHQGTAVGALVNLALFLALLFWPSGDYENSPPPFSEARRPGPSPRGGGAISVAAERIARASGEFGRRPV
jgi:uncharacterized membrane protein YhaH (DUF805 family)